MSYIGDLAAMGLRHFEISAYHPTSAGQLEKLAESYQLHPLKGKGLVYFTEEQYRAEEPVINAMAQIQAKLEQFLRGINALPEHYNILEEEFFRWKDELNRDESEENQDEFDEEFTPEVTAILSEYTMGEYRAKSILINSLASTRRGVMIGFSLDGLNLEVGTTPSVLYYIETGALSIVHIRGIKPLSDYERQIISTL